MTDKCPKCGYKGRPVELGCGGHDCPMLTARNLRDIAQLSGAEHEHQYLYGGCPECGCFYDPYFDWQHFYGCSRATQEQPAQKKPYLHRTQQHGS